jgi:hypothetical protein
MAERLLASKEGPYFKESDMVVMVVSHMLM